MDAHELAADGADHSALSTDEVPAAESVAYWREVVCATFVQVYTDPTSPDFQGSIRHARVGPLRLSTLASTPQLVRRTARQIDSTHEPQLLANIQLNGTGTIRQDGRVALLAPGDMCFYEAVRGRARGARGARIQRARRRQPVHVTGLHRRHG